MNLYSSLSVNGVLLCTVINPKVINTDQYRTKNIGTILPEVSLSPTAVMWSLKAASHTKTMHQTSKLSSLEKSHVQDV